MYEVYGAFTDYVDSFLQTSSSSVVADQLFEGYVDSIEYRQEPDTITLHCVDDAIELERQYDETYGRATTTFTPSYGATDDISALVNALLPSGWTYTCPDCAIHEKMTVSIGTRRLYALFDLLDLVPYLGFYVLPMKHIVFVMPDTSPAPDAWTDATAGWTAYGDADAPFIQTIDTVIVDGAHALIGGMNADGTFGVRRGDALGISLTSYRYITLYYTLLGTDANTAVLRLWENIAGSKYWTYTLMDTWGAATPGDMVRATIQLPESGNAHGWVATNAPDVAGNIQRIEYEAEQSGGLGTGRIIFDVLYFHADKKLTSKYTVSNITGANRTPITQAENRIILKSNTNTYVVDDIGLQALYGLREDLITDLSVSGNEASYNVARAILISQQWGVDYDTITMTIVNPSDMYNVMPGDTLTVTVANLNLSSATRSLVSRRDSVTEGGWTTTLILGKWSALDPLLTTYSKLKRKRY
jgi:hypothetical protein